MLEQKRILEDVDSETFCIVWRGFFCSEKVLPPEVRGQMKRERGFYQESCLESFLHK